MRKAKVLLLTLLTAAMMFGCGKGEVSEQFPPQLPRGTGPGIPLRHP